MGWGWGWGEEQQEVQPGEKRRGNRNRLSLLPKDGVHSKISTLSTADVVATSAPGMSQSKFSFVHYP